MKITSRKSFTIPTIHGYITYYNIYVNEEKYGETQYHHNRKDTIPVFNHTELRNQFTPIEQQNIESDICHEIRLEY